MVNENTCPVCGYQMSEPANNYNVCSSCGTEFGVSDVNSSLADLRDAWLESGPTWWSKAEEMPENWNPLKQMEDAGISMKRPVASVETSVSTTSVSVFIVGAANWEASGIVQQPYDKQREVGSR